MRKGFGQTDGGFSGKDGLATVESCPNALLEQITFEHRTVSYYPEIKVVFHTAIGDAQCR